MNLFGLCTVLTCSPYSFFFSESSLNLFLLIYSNSFIFSSYSLIESINLDWYWLLLSSISKIGIFFTLDSLCNLIDSSYFFSCSFISSKSILLIFLSSSFISYFFFNYSSSTSFHFFCIYSYSFFCCNNDFSFLFYSACNVFCSYLLFSIS